MWTVGSAAGWLDPRTLSAPWTVVTTAGDLIADGRLQDNLCVSPQRAGLGLALRGRCSAPCWRWSPGSAGSGEALLDGPIQIKRAIPVAGADPAADPLARHRRGDEGHHDHPRRLRPRLHPHPQRAAHHRQPVRRAGRDAAAARRRRSCADRAARRAARLPARHAVRGDRRVAVPGGRRADQLHQRHRLHDGSGPRSTARPTSSSSASSLRHCSGCCPTAPSGSSQRRALSWRRTLAD